jgi:hypothetical protein
MSPPEHAATSVADVGSMAAREQDALLFLSSMRGLSQVANKKGEAKKKRRKPDMPRDERSAMKKVKSTPNVTTAKATSKPKNAKPTSVNDITAMRHVHVSRSIRKDQRGLMSLQEERDQLASLQNIRSSVIRPQPQNHRLEELHSQTQTLQRRHEDQEQEDQQQQQQHDQEQRIYHLQQKHQHQHQQQQLQHQKRQQQARQHQQQVDRRQQQQHDQHEWQQYEFDHLASRSASPSEEVSSSASPSPPQGPQAKTNSFASTIVLPLPKVRKASPKPAQTRQTSYDLLSDYWMSQQRQLEESYKQQLEACAMMAYHGDGGYGGSPDFSSLMACGSGGSLDYNTMAQIVGLTKPSRLISPGV